MYAMAAYVELRGKRQDRTCETEECAHPSC